MVRMNSFQHRNRDTGADNKHMDTKGARGRSDGLAGWDRHTHSAMYKT